MKNLAPTSSNGWVLSNLGITNSPEETQQLGCAFGKTLKEGSIICFFGDLAAGKTTFIKGLVEGAANYPSALVNSPTFVYLNIYEGTKTIYHFDLYRLSGPEEFLEMGFDEHLFGQGICCIEWSERISTHLPPHAIFIKMEHVDEGTRKITKEGL